ncbi:MAG: tRNA glutamyl-Q(34) synthetase GluQRS [Opitutales bacterium]
MPAPTPYRGRLAPTPTGYLHLGHARTFHTAWKRARQAQGKLIVRIEDLDPRRCRAEFAEAAVADLRWLGLDWDASPELGGPHAPYIQSQRRAIYAAAWEQLRAGGWIYPCWRSRKDLREAPTAPHEHDATAEALYLSKWRPEPGLEKEFEAPGIARVPEEGIPNWRFRVPAGTPVRFEDGRCGAQTLTAGEDFGDFVIWNREDVPAYELAVVVDDAAMAISEVVRGEDLLKSTARQLLVYEALGLEPPLWWHTPLLRDGDGQRLAKRHASLSLRELRARGEDPQKLLEASDAELQALMS